jgi:hypothetical protein
MLRLQPKPLHLTSPTSRPQKRLRILGEEELDALYGLPHFTPEERHSPVSHKRAFLILAGPTKQDSQIDLILCFRTRLSMKFSNVLLSDEFCDRPSVASSTFFVRLLSHPLPRKRKSRQWAAV